MNIRCNGISFDFDVEFITAHWNYLQRSGCAPELHPTLPFSDPSKHNLKPAIGIIRLNIDKFATVIYQVKS